MPNYEYTCPTHGRIEKFFPTFSEAEKHIDQTTCSEEVHGWTGDGEYVTEPCGETAMREVSVPLAGMFYGNPDGYHKPSATKRYSTKLVAQKGNDSAVG